MRGTLVFLTFMIFGSMALAGYKGIPSYEFDYTSTSIENVKAKVDECRKAIEDEKKKVTSSGYKIVEETACMSETFNDKGKTFDSVRGRFSFLK